MINNFLELIKKNNTLKAQYILSRINKNKSTSRHITVKLQNIKNKANFKNSQRGEINYFQT